MSDLQAPDLLRGLRRHWWVVLLLMALGAAAGAGGSLLVPDQWVGRAQVQVLHDPRLDVLQDEASDTYETVDEANRRMDSVAVAALSDQVVSRTAREVDATPAAVRRDVDVEPLAGADVLVFSGRADDPEAAAELAQAAAEAFIAVSQQDGRAQLIAGAVDLDGQADEILADVGEPVPAATREVTDQLYSRAYELRTRAAVFNGLGQLVTSADPDTATAPPAPSSGAGLGLAAGFLAGVAVALLLSTRRGRPADRAAPSQTAEGEQRRP